MEEKKEESGKIGEYLVPLKRRGISYCSRMEKEVSTQDRSEAEAANIINRNVAGTKSAEDLEQKIKADTRNITDETRGKLSTYIDGIKDATDGAEIKKLENGVGGLYDGKNQFIAESTLQVRGSIEKTIAQANETGEHEGYHAKHKHLEAMKTVQDAEFKDGEQQPQESLQLGGKSFNETAVIEGLTVHDTGKEFVSGKYVQYEEDLVSAAANAGVSMDKVRTAVNEEKDLTLIDDRTRQNAAEPQFAMAG